MNLVRVLATVKNPAGELVGALNKDDFEILDNGVKQQIAVFERQTEQPLSVAMMVDASGSTAKDLKYEVDSVARFFKALFAEGNPKDAVALYSFNYQVTLHNFFTHNQAPLEHSLRLIQGEAGTSLVRRDIPGVPRPGVARGTQGHGDRHRRRRHHQREGFPCRAGFRAIGQRGRSIRCWWCPSPTMPAATSAASTP